jgi:hypothetical protein
MFYRPAFNSLPIHLPDYPVPQSIRDELNTEDPFMNEDNPFPMTPETQIGTLRKLLYIELVQMERDIRNYDMTSVTLIKTQHPQKLILRGKLKGQAPSKTRIELIIYVCSAGFE